MLLFTDLAIKEIYFLPYHEAVIKVIEVNVSYFYAKLDDMSFFLTNVKLNV